MDLALKRLKEFKIVMDSKSNIVNAEHVYSVGKNDHK